MMALEELISHVEQRLRAEFGNSLLGVLVGGSRVRDEAAAASDLDVVVVIRELKKCRRNVVVKGVEAELLINPPQAFKQSFERERLNGRADTAHLMSTGRVVCDPEGTVRALVSEAQATWDLGPPPFSQRQAWMSRFAAADLLRDIEDVRQLDEEQTHFLIGALLGQLIHDHYRIRGRWLEKKKRVFKEMSLWDPAAAQLAREASCGPLKQRYEAIRAFTARVLEPLGGLMPTEWGTNWEKVTLVP